MLKTPRERAEQNRRYRARILAAQLVARRRNKAARHDEVRTVLQQHNDQMARLSKAEMRKMLPVLDKAQTELSSSMRAWITNTPDGELRWTAHSYRGALLHITKMQRDIGKALSLRVDSSISAAQDLAIDHLTDEVARFSQIFDGSAGEVPLNAARLVATGESYRIARIANSAKRYAGAVGQDIRQRLAVDMLKGARVSDTIKRLRQDGGPKGLVALEGVVGDKSAVVELIPEGLFARYEHFASRIVRTEISAAYGQQSLDGIKDAASNGVDGLMKRWCADGGGCPEICGPMDGETVGIDEEFMTPIGPVDSTPAHPNCGCRTGAWKESWDDILTY